MRLEVFIDLLESTEEVIVRRQNKQGIYYLGPARYTPHNLYNRVVLEIVFHEECTEVVVD